MFRHRNLHSRSAYGPTGSLARYEDLTAPITFSPDSAKDTAYDTRTRDRLCNEMRYCRCQLVL